MDKVTVFLKRSSRILAVFIGLVQSTNAAVSINGSGSTFAEPIYSRWISDYQKVEKSALFNYQGVGSGAGMKQLIEGTVDFAGTDDPMKAEDAAKAKAEILHVPVALGAVVVGYNLPVDKPLKLSGTIIAKIFNGGIKKWNDVEIAKLNPGLKIPDTAISVATRSDGSGTTAVFSEYLSKVSPDWSGKNGKTVKWFAGSLGAKGNAGVAGLVKGNPGTVGYIELVYALENKIPFADVQNKKNEFVTASTQSVTAAAQGLAKEAQAKLFKLSITDSTQSGAYPISSFTWLLIPEKLSKEKGGAILGFAKYALGDEAQKTATSLHYASVPKEIRASALTAIGKVKLE